MTISGAGADAVGRAGGGSTIRSLLRMRSSGPQLPAAARAGLCMLVPLSAGMLADRLDLGLVASLGAFAVMYTGGGRWRPVTATAAAAVAIVVGVLLGRLVAGHPWWIGACTAAFAAVATLAWEWWRLGMPGMPLLVLPCALSSGIPPGDIWRDVGLCAAVGLLACLINMPGRRSGARRSQAESTRSGDVDVPRRLPRRTGAVTSPPVGILLMAARVAAAVLLAAVATRLSGLGDLTWAMATAAAVLGLGSQHRIVVDRAVHRTVGTVAGVGVAALVLVVDPRGWAFVIVLTLLQGAVQLLVTRNYALSMLVITPLALLLHSALSEPTAVPELVALRIGETVVGAAAGVLVAYFGFRSTWAAPLLRHTVGTALDAAISLHALREGRSAASPAAGRWDDVVTLHEFRLRRRLEDLERSVERTSAERRSVRQAAATMKPLVDATRSTAEEVLHSSNRPTLSRDLRALRYEAARPTD